MLLDIAGSANADSTDLAGNVKTSESSKSVVEEEEKEFWCLGRRLFSGWPISMGCPKRVRLRKKKTAAESHDMTIEIFI